MKLLNLWGIEHYKDWLKIVIIYNYGFILYNVFYEEEILFKKLGIKWG